MARGTVFRVAFWFIFGGMIAIQLYFSSRTRLSGERKTTEIKSKSEMGAHTVFRVIRTLLFIVILVLNALNPSWLKVLSVPFPDWVRWLGIVLGLASYVVYIWSRAALGRYWSSRLRVSEKHDLVIEGPYARIRHPIYLAMICYLTSLTLVSSHLFFIVVLLFSIIDLALRIPKEEQMMIEEFGDTYREYIKRTGRLLPK
ncbi:MAG: isoprenylcysteine carboxylmethyltransferase family protein [Anaerolineales bacterium]|nr:isoprenylcysteine carboxylmethyltransferase family protein [Anaerolineales bacterium]